MGREVNIDSIRALEKQIEEGEGDIIKLKRTRNSLNISIRVPPEILGYIFIWSLGREEDHSLSTDSHFHGLRKGSYNFLLVCHHWFEVASNIPELWSLWGNTLQVWEERSRRPGVAPVDLVLVGKNDPKVPICESLSHALRDRAMQDTIRQIHLSAAGVYILSEIYSSSTPDDEDVRHVSIESIDLRNRESPSVDVSEFFARRSFPQLRSLFLHGLLQMPSWDQLARQTTLLTTLSLDVLESSPALPPTTSQLLSILAANPNLRQLLVGSAVIPEDDSDGSESRVPLGRLKTLCLTGELHRVFRLLDRLTLPGTLDLMAITALDSTVEDVSQIPGPYIREYIRRHHRLQGGLGIGAHSLHGHLYIYVEVVGELDTWATFWREPLPSVEFKVILDEITPPDVLNNLCLDLIAFAPRERAVGLNTTLPTNRMEDLLTTMPNIAILHLSGVTVSKGFLQPNPEGPRANTKLLPSLRSLHLEDITLSDDDWGHITTYLGHQTSDDQTVSFMVSTSSYMPLEVIDEIKGLVRSAFGYSRRPSTDSEGSWSPVFSEAEGEDEEF